VTALYRRYHDDARSDDERAKVKAEFDAALASVEPGALFETCGREHELFVDPSETAAVALEALRASRGVAYLGDSFTTRLVVALLAIVSDPSGPDPRRRDRIDLREPARRLAVRLVALSRDPKGPPPARVAETARQTREVLRDALRNGASGQSHAPARSILDEAGWGSAAEIRDLAESLEQLLFSDAARVVAGRAYGAAEDEPLFLARARGVVPNLRAIAALSTSDDPDESAGGKSVLAWLSDLRDRQAKKELPADGELVLELWNEKPGPKR
jgi:hypothetical protein